MMCKLPYEYIDLLRQQLADWNILKHFVSKRTGKPIQMITNEGIETMMRYLSQKARIVEDIHAFKFLGNPAILFITTKNTSKTGFYHAVYWNGISKLYDPGYKRRKRIPKLKRIYCIIA